MDVLNEIETAHWARFSRFNDFRRALRDGRFPKPDRELPDGPRWDRSSLERWLKKQGVTLAQDEAELMARIGKWQKE